MVYSLLAAGRVYGNVKSARNFHFERETRLSDVKFIVIVVQTFVVIISHNHCCFAIKMPMLSIINNIRVISFRSKYLNKRSRIIKELDHTRLRNFQNSLKPIDP